MVAGDPLLAAGFDAFARHGFKRATMADIAAGAGMSRPALYLRVKGKEDVLRAVGAALLTDSAARARTAADETGDIATRVVAVLEAKLGLTLGLAERSEHALELLAEYGRVATTGTAQYTAEIEQLTARVLAATGAGADRCADIATALVRTVQGLETELDDAPRARKLLMALVNTTVDGLTRS
ncbi:TetR family transcriptional regulator [Lentzea pudingi]|uniref:TetR family transcriptional regulator n=1 Tax=Lentzea pudingi TaxID=1789439 RepID=A0ABQ2HXJ7_9PSEU|nr:TetR family transcriptional regulator [Lentzea pudingi]